MRSTKEILEDVQQQLDEKVNPALETNRFRSAPPIATAGVMTPATAGNSSLAKQTAASPMILDVEP